MERWPLGNREERRALREGRNVSEVQLFRDDVVQSIAEPSMIGVVSKVGGDSESEDSEDSEEEDEEAREEVTAGSARVCWMNAKESTEQLSKVRVIDRAFLHGDIVAKASEPLGQTGTVVDVEMMVDLELPNGELMKDVNSRRLRRVRAFALGDYVIHDMWLGQVDDVVDNVTVLFEDGSKCKVMRADPGRLCPVNEFVMDDSDCPYFQGQKVCANSPSVFKNAKWLKGCWKAGRTEGIVAELEPGSVLVDWVAAGHVLGNVPLSNFQPSVIPSEEQDAANLVAIIDFSHTNWQLGDRTLPPTSARPKNVAPADDNQVDGTASDGDAEGASKSQVARTSETVDVNSCWSGEGCKAGGEVWTSHRRRGKQQRRPIKREKKLQKTDKALEYALLIVSTRTTVDVLWQDGTTSQGIDSCSLISVDHLGDHDFWPEQYVMERGADGEGLDGDHRRVGIVKVVDGKQRTASVKWLKNTDPSEERLFESEETVSVYELVEHPDYSYCLGDKVIRLSSPVPSDGNASVESSNRPGSSGLQETSNAYPEVKEPQVTGGHKQAKKDAKRKLRKAKPSSQDLSWAGLIVGLRDGDIEVAWADGTISKVGPQGILVVNRDMDDSSTAHTSDLEGGEDVDDAASWETVVSDGEGGRENQGNPEEWAGRRGWDPELSASPGDEQGTGSESPTDSRVGHGDRDVGTDGHASQNFGGPFKLPLVALDLVSRIATGLLGLRGKTDTNGSCEEKRAPGSTSAQGAVEDGLLSGESPASPSKRHTADSDSPSQSQGNGFESVKNGVSESTTLEEQNDPKSSSELSCVPDFDQSGMRFVVASTPSIDDADRQHYADVLGAAGRSPDEAVDEARAIKHFDAVKDASDHHYLGESVQPTNRKWAKKIQQEWSMLERNLPDTIYVRVYEERMDLLRAVIVGAAGTPYHDGLFVFDLCMPPEYPSLPPVVHYHSGGLRLNPNLYENGKVCLSLLNTWAGKGSEIWHPSTSSVLQLLVSVQGLVLNEKPYFNEAGYERQVGTGEGEKNSLLYNENSFLLSCKSMLYLLRRPPQHFKELIGNHFRSRGHNLLMQCRAYLAGAAVGSLKDVDLSNIEERKFEDQSSAGFKLMLNKLVPKLATAFAEVGAKIPTTL